MQKTNRVRNGTEWPTGAGMLLAAQVVRLVIRFQMGLIQGGANELWRQGLYQENSRAAPTNQTGDDRSCSQHSNRFARRAKMDRGTEKKGCGKENTSNRVAAAHANSLAHSRGHLALWQLVQLAHTLCDFFWIFPKTSVVQNWQHAKFTSKFPVFTKPCDERRRIIRR